MLTERDTLLARYSLKYFGLEKGVVSHSLIANHVPINCLLIGANMHESHYLFDLFYNNTSLIKPDILATDTEGSNQLNFLLLNVIDKLFAPRYRTLSAKTETIISFGEQLIAGLGMLWHICNHSLYSKGLRVYYLTNQLMFGSQSK